MLRGLDANSRGRRGDGDEPSIIKVADRTLPEAAATVYVDRSAEDEAARRADYVVEELGRLQDAGVLESVSVVAWQETDVADRYEEFLEAAGERAIEPFFTSLADGNAFEVPSVCVVLEDGGEITGLYPKRAGGADHHVEDCLRALASGDRVENLDRR